MTDVALVGLSIADPPERWAAIGFPRSVESGRLLVGSVWITLGIAPQGDGIVGWTLDGLTAEGDIDGLATGRGTPSSGELSLALPPNAVTAIDHVVLTTPDLDRLAAVLDARGLELARRARNRGRAMGFRRLVGGPILEVVEAPDSERTAFWGVTFAVARAASGHDLLADLAARSRFVSEPRPAVQPGRRIATVDRSAGLSTRVAFIDPEAD